MLNGILDVNISAGLHGAGPRNLLRGTSLDGVSLSIFTGSIWTGSGYYNLHGVGFDPVSEISIFFTGSRDRPESREIPREI